MAYDVERSYEQNRRGGNRGGRDYSEDRGSRAFGHWDEGRRSDSRDDVDRYAGRHSSGYDAGEDYSEERFGGSEDRSSRSYSDRGARGGYGDERYSRDRDDGSYGYRGRSGGQDRDYGQRDYDQQRGYGRDRDSSGRGRGRYGGAGYAADNEAGGGANTGRRIYSPDYGSSQGWGGGDSGRDDFSGVGPKNYTRSDDRIREDVCDNLTGEPRLDAADIEVKVESGEVTLDGTVPSSRCKRQAEDLAEEVSGAKHIQNNLRVAERERQQLDSNKADQSSEGQTASATK